MDLVSTVRKTGSRGGVNFSWDDVAGSAHRENYLGHSLKAPVGRWQRGRDLSWYAKGDASTAAEDGETEQEREARERREELRKIKEIEEDAISRALGLPVPQRNTTGANSTEVVGNRIPDGAAPAEVGRVGQMVDGGERREREGRDFRDTERRHRRRHRDRNQDRSRERRRDRSPRRRHDSRERRPRTDDARRRSRSPDMARRERRHRHRSYSRSPDRSERRRRSRSRDRERPRSPPRRRSISPGRHRSRKEDRSLE